MKKVALLIITTTIAFLLFSCKNGNENKPLIEDVDIQHRYSFTSSAPVQLRFQVRSALDNLFFDGVDQNIWSIDKIIEHIGTKAYTINTMSSVLHTDISIEPITKEEKVVVTYTWVATINGKQVKLETKKLTLSEKHHLKTHSTPDTINN